MDNIVILEKEAVPNTAGLGFGESGFGNDFHRFGSRPPILRHAAPHRVSAKMPRYTLVCCFVRLLCAGGRFFFFKLRPFDSMFPCCFHC